MKKYITLFLLLIHLCILAGCTKCINTEYKEVEVNIIDEYYKPSYTTVEYNVTLKMPMTKSHPAVYRITVEYDGINYVMSGSSTYNKYKDKVGEVCTGSLEVRSYDDGTKKYRIVSLK